jgi:Rho-binding antiterminator
MQAYRPINCEFHDVLESCAILRKPVCIEVQSPDGARRSFSAVITDVFSKEGAEFLRTDGGDTLRLDALVCVDGVSATAFGV